MTVGVVDGSSGGCEVVSPLPNPMLSGDNVDKLPLPPSSGVLVTVQNIIHKDHNRYTVKYQHNIYSRSIAYPLALH